MDPRSDPLPQLLCLALTEALFSPATGTKVFVMPNGMLKSNQQLVDIIEKVKPEIRLLIEKCNTVGLHEWGQQGASAPGGARLRVVT